MSFYKYRDYFLLGAGFGAFLCYKFYSFPFMTKAYLNNNQDNFEGQRILYNNLSKFNFNNKRPKLLLINSDLPICQIMNSHRLPKDLDVFKISLDENNKSEMYYLNNILGFYGNNIYNINFQQKPIDPKQKNQNIAINSYGDVKRVSNDKINQMEYDTNKKSFISPGFNMFGKHKSKGLNIFKRLNIINTKEKFLKMGTHDFMLLYCTKQKKDKIPYSLKEFVIYRYIYRKMLKGYNINFYTKINDYPIDELDKNELIDTDNHVYIVQKQNIINKELFKDVDTVDTSLPINNNNVTDELNTFLSKKNLIVKIDGSNFYFTDITKDLDNNFKNNYMNKLITKGNLFYYVNNNELKLNQNNIKCYFQQINKCFPKNGYFHIICNLFFNRHRNQLINFISEYKKNINKVDENTPLLVNDCLSIVKSNINILQFFKEKYYEIDQVPINLKDKCKVKSRNNEQCMSGVIFKKKIFDIERNPLLWLKDKDISPKNINFFPEIKYLF